VAERIALVTGYRGRDAAAISAMVDEFMDSAIGGQFRASQDALSSRVSEEEARGWGRGAPGDKEKGKGKSKGKGKGRGSRSQR
jgi:hypothetical protein